MKKSEIKMGQAYCARASKLDVFVVLSIAEYVKLFDFHGKTIVTITFKDFKNNYERMSNDEIWCERLKKYAVFVEKILNPELNNFLHKITLSE